MAKGKFHTTGLWLHSTKSSSARLVFKSNNFPWPWAEAEGVENVNIKCDYIQKTSLAPLRMRYIGIKPFHFERMLVKTSML